MIKRSSKFGTVICNKIQTGFRGNLVEVGVDFRNYFTSLHVDSKYMYDVTLGNIGSKIWALQLVTVIQIFGSEDTLSLIILIVVRSLSAFQYIDI